VIIAGAIVAGLLFVLAVLLFAPVEARVGLAPGEGVNVTVLWLGLRFRVAGGARRPKPAGRRKAKAKRTRGPLNPLRLGRAAMKVGRLPGVRGLLWRTAVKAVKAVHIQRGFLIVSAGFGDAFLTGWLAGLAAAIRPRFQAGGGRFMFEFSPDFGRAGIVAFGELVVWTRPFPWVAIAVQLLCSRTTWEARRAWREAMRPKI
jgi:hypothetical protein